MEPVKSKFNDYSGVNDKSVTVYCWSRTEVGSPLWEQAEAVGRMAAEAGFSVVTGGYCGSMEAVSKGAREHVDKVSGGGGEEAVDETNAPAATSPAPQSSLPQVRGMLVPGLFPDRVTAGNKHLTHYKDTTSLSHRLDLLTSQSRYYIVLPGTLGTLTELALIWSLSLLHHPEMPKPIIICYRDPWERTIKHIAEDLSLPESNTSLIQFVDNAEEGIAIIKADDTARSQAAASS